MAGAASQTYLVLQVVPLAGFAHHQGHALWGQMKTGDRLRLRAEPGNRFDGQAVRVEWQEHLIGYLPRQENGPLTLALRQGLPVEGRIASLREHPNPRERIRIEILLPVPRGGGT